MQQEQNPKNKITVIKSDGFSGVNFKELLSYKDLIFLFAKRDISVKYRQTILGPLWFLIMPVLTALISAFVFGNIAKLDSGGVPYFAFHLTSITVWSLFSGCFIANANTFTANARLFKKVYFPRMVVPISHILSTLFKFSIQLLLLIAVLVIYAINGAYIAPDWRFIWLLPLIFLQFVLLSLGLSLIFSSLTAKYRDLSALVSVGVDFLKYLTPVVYTLSSLSDTAKYVFLINPLSGATEAFRYAILGSGGAIYPLHLIVGAIQTVIVLAVGLILFYRTERNFIDTV